jgi:AcrR family transcriptional regulator
MSKTVNELKHQEHKLKIIGKAQALFAEKGYSETSMADIAEACEVQKATLYHYFDSKEALLFGILDCHANQDKQNERFCRLFSGKTLEERLYQMGKFHLEEMDTKEALDFMKILLVETTTSGRMKEYYQAFIHKQMEIMVEEVVKPVAQDGMSPIEMKRLVFQFFASLMHYSWQTRMVGKIDDIVGDDDAYLHSLAKTFGNQQA